MLEDEFIILLDRTDSVPDREGQEVSSQPMYPRNDQKSQWGPNEHAAEGHSTSSDTLQLRHRVLSPLHTHLRGSMLLREKQKRTGIT